MPLFHFHSYLRAAVELPVELRSQDFSGVLAGKISRLSEEGAVFTSDRPVSVSATVVFDLPLPPEKNPVHVESDVLWCRSVFDEGRKQYAHGLLFSRLGIEARERLTRFIGNSMNY